jgi:hypothetical protein
VKEWLRVIRKDFWVSSRIQVDNQRYSRDDDIQPGILQDWL